MVMTMTTMRIMMVEVVVVVSMVDLVTAAERIVGGSNSE